MIFCSRPQKFTRRNFVIFIASSICGRLSHLETDSGGILVWFPDRLVLPAYDHCGLYEKKFLCYRTAFSRFHRGLGGGTNFFSPVLLRFHAAGCVLISYLFPGIAMAYFIQGYAILEILLGGGLNLITGFTEMGFSDFTSFACGFFISLQTAFSRRPDRSCL